MPHREVSFKLHGVAALASKLSCLQPFSSTPRPSPGPRTKARRVHKPLGRDKGAVGVTAESFQSRPRTTQPSSAQRLSALACFLVVLLFAGRASAAKDPVPLDPKADPYTCIACHEDKTKGKSVHSAIALGCTSCHEVRVNREVTRVKLITPTPVAIGLTCHTDKNSAAITGRVHPPAARDCLKCHDPHASDNKNQLLKPESGDQKENLCLTCHTTGLNVPAKGSRHAALDMGQDCPAGVRGMESSMLTGL